jgi:antitoxin component of MazEF toxin-antitoxin module
MAKTLYAIQPYRVGGKHGTSLAIVIPAPVVKQLGLSPESILSLRLGEDSITLASVVAQ